MNNDLVFLIQARLGSTRLPNKMILPFWKEKSILQIILNKIKANFADIPVVLATSIQPENERLVQVAKECDCLYYQGSENDVLSRFIEASETFNKSRIIRICADNPFIDMHELNVLINNIEDQDYLSFKVHDTPSIKTHYGFWAEYTTLTALQGASKMTDELFYHEHVTNYLYENPEKFNIEFLSPSVVLDEHKDIRMTIDTQEDFVNLSQIYSKLFEKYNSDFGINEILQFLEEQPDYKLKMKEQILKNTK